MNTFKSTRLIDISPRAWEHPADKAALRAAKAVPGFDVIIQKLVGLTSEKWMRLHFLASAVRVNQHQYAEVYTLYQEACSVLDVKEMPELYISNSPFYNAGVYGVDKPFIVLNSVVVAQSKPEEILHILGHELGHCLSGHALYLTVIRLLNAIAQYLLVIPGVGILNLGVLLALLEWQRKAELTADRAALLVTQNTDFSYKALMKLAGGADTDKMNINEFFNQAGEYQASESAIDSSYKLLQLVWQTHPFPVLRLTELKSWVDSGQYSNIINGQYPRRSEQPPEDVFEDVNNAGKSYRDDFATSEDPLARAFSGIYSVADSVVDGVSNTAKDVFGAIFGSGRDASASEGGDKQSTNGNGSGSAG